MFVQGDRTVQVLEDVSWQLEAGETAAILGPSGSGKSTFLALIAGLDLPTVGEVVLNGQRLATLNEDDLTRFRAKTLSIVFQQFHLMANMTALENTALPLELAGHPLARERAAEVLEAVGLFTRKDHFPRQLSGGECQRVAIARAMVLSPIDSSGGRTQRQSR
jgi:putative ABC transport system ATP-binding protein